MTNFSAGHETRVKSLFADRLAYPLNHIEVDNRLSWFLGRLNEKFGKHAYYVHLLRDREATARSFAKRLGLKGGIIGAYEAAIVGFPKADPLDVCRDYVDTVTENIRTFLADKPHVMTIRLEDMRSDFHRFWDWIEAIGDLDAALADWNVRPNASD